MYLDDIRAGVGQLIEAIEAAVEAPPAPSEDAELGWVARHPVIYATGLFAVCLVGARLLRRVRHVPRTTRSGFAEPRRGWPAQPPGMVH